jgi:hypothetical protein
MRSVFGKAAKLVEKRWYTGPLGRCLASYAIDDALRDATGGDRALLDQCTNLLCVHLNIVSLWQWNDAYGRTKEEVLTVLQNGAAGTLLGPPPERKIPPEYQSLDAPAIATRVLGWISDSFSGEGFELTPPRLVGGWGRVPCRRITASPMEGVQDACDALNWKLERKTRDPGYASASTEYRIGIRRRVRDRDLEFEIEIHSGGKWGYVRAMIDPRARIGGEWRQIFSWSKWDKEPWHLDEGAWWPVFLTRLDAFEEARAAALVRSQNNEWLRKQAALKKDDAERKAFAESHGGRAVR